MRSGLFSVAVLTALQFSVTLANEYDLHFYPLEARDVGEFEMLGREMKKNGAPMTGLDITSDLEKRGMSLNPRQTCPSGYGLCPSSGRCCRSPGRCCDDGTCIVSGETCCSTGGACRVARKCCGNGCIPSSAVCCSNDGDYCDAGYLCCRTGYCVLPGGECCRDYGTCRPGYRCVINSSGERGCRRGTSGGGGSSIGADPTSRGDTVSNPPSTTPAPTTRPSVEYRWYSTTIYWYYYWYYYVWISTIDYTSTRSSRTSTSTVVSAYVTGLSVASSSFDSIASDLTSSTPSQESTEFEGPTPTPIDRDTTSSSASTSSTPTASASASSSTGGSNFPPTNGGDVTNPGGNNDNAPSTGSQYRARDVLAFAPIVFLLTLVYIL